jgi:acetyltransferase-like isoleucine patch superfamily enzyme
VIHAAVEDFSNLRIGNNCRILRECFLDLTDRIEIADTACLAMRTMLITHLNVASSPLGQKELPPHSAPITVGPGAVTFAGVTILKGVTLGECAVVAAGAVVATTVPPWTLVGGNPARVIRRLQPTEKAENLL